MNNPLLNFQYVTNEAERINALHKYQILDTPTEPSFDNITRLASKLLNVPIALISFVDDDRIWCKSHFGTDVSEYEKIEGFCASAINQSHPYIINDASTDPRSSDHPLVKQSGGVRFYAGIPLNIEGNNIGTLCIIDFKTRPTLTDDEIETLQLLSKMVVESIKSHGRNLEVINLHNNLTVSEHHFRSVFNQTGVGLYLANGLTGQFIETNKCYQEMLGYSALELASRNLLDLTYPEDLSHQQLVIQQLCSGKTTEYNLQKRYIRKDGSVLWVDITCTALWKAGEDPTAHISVVQDINDKKLAEIALKESEQRWSFALDGTNQGVWDLNVVSNQIFLSPRCKEMLGYSEEQISTNMSEWVKLIHPDDIPCLFSARMQALDGEVKSFENEHRKLTSDGTWKWIHVKGMVVERDANNAPMRVIGTYTDISERKKIEADVLRLAHYDTITGLPNRTLFIDRLNQEVKKSKRSGKSFALLVLDLDRFKEVNDSYGHQKGDLLIKEIGTRLSSCVRESDTVSRLGGDEFTIILSEFNQVNDIDHLVLKILDSISASCLLDGDIIYVTASVGIALFPDNTIDSDELLKHADMAMYSAKNNGKNTFAFFTQSMQKHAFEKTNIANNLRNALVRKEFLLLYQPIINLNTLEMHKAEALIRWQHPDEGLISPALFIPIAEDTGQIVEIGEWVFKEAVKAIKTCREKIHPEFQMSINKSPLQFRMDNKPHTSWFGFLNALNLPGNCLVIEITESLLLDKSAGLNEKLKDLKEAGIQIALDDFGTGYSSLSYLKHYDIDYIKIDQVFVKNLKPNSEDFVLCEAIIVMAHKLNMKVIAEGVETAEQLKLLQSIGCDFGQGYYFSRPIKLEDLYHFKVIVR